MIPDSRLRSAARRAGAGLLLAGILLGGIGAARAPGGSESGGYPWLYLRGGSQPQAGEALVEVIAVGDIMLGRAGVDPAGSLSHSAAWLREADLALGNLEGVLGDPAEAPGDDYAPYRLVMRPEAARELGAAGFDLLGLANNHALDLGAGGLAATARLLELSGIQTVGAIAAAGDPPRAVTVEVDGLRLAVLAVTVLLPPDAGRVGEGQLPALWDEQGVTSALKQARQQADALIVSIHWGYENQRRISARQAELARKLVEAGADLVVGHHPHVVQGTEIVAAGGAQDEKFAFVAYSLGNFAFDQFERRNRQGLALRAFFDRKGLRAVQALPVLAGPRPRWLRANEMAEFGVDLAPRLPQLVFTCDRQACQAAPGADSLAGDPFRSGQIDLTGDGRPETVRLSAGRVMILEGGQPAWQSPPEWQVLDLALGDPNQDGRGEALLALLKPDKEGRLRSHPFIIGQRGGIYRQVWGGSPVSEPIRQVELGDVDGDGRQELVVLDELPGTGLQTVGVWRWNGWGFSLGWRSQPGRYADLRLVEEQGAPARISVGVWP